MKQNHSKPPAVVVKHEGKAMYLGELAAFPRQGETIWLGSNSYLISRVEWDFNARLREILGATSVTVRSVVRPYSEAIHQADGRLPVHTTQPPTGRVAG